MTAAFTNPREGRQALLTLLCDGEHPLELRSRTPRGHWGKDWADTPQEADERAHRRTARGDDVYVGMLPRLGRAGDDQRRYAPSRVLWVDTARSVRKLELFEPMPTAIVRSGGIDGDEAKRHAYWALQSPLPAQAVKQHALRIQHHLEGDPASTEAARILRVPGSINHKTGNVATVEHFTGDVHALAAITGELPDSPDYAPPDAPKRAKSTDELEELFAGTYHEGGEDGRHEHFRSIVGVLLARCPWMPPDVLLELAVCWAQKHTVPCRPRAELERNFDNLLARELTRRGLA